MHRSISLLAKVGLLFGAILVFLTPEVHCYKNRKFLQIFANTDVFSTSGGGWPGFNFAGAQAAGQATVDQGEAKTSGQTATNAPGGDLLNAICSKPSDSATAQALGQAFAAGKDSAQAASAAKAVAAAGEQCCDNLKTALAQAASFSQASGKGDAFVSAASKSQAEATSVCGKEALAQSISGSRASNGNSQAAADASGSASGPNAKTTTQTQTNVGPGFSSSSSSSVATSG